MKGEGIRSSGEDLDLWRCLGAGEKQYIPCFVLPSCSVKLVSALSKSHLKSCFVVRVRMRRGLQWVRFVGKRNTFYLTDTVDKNRVFLAVSLASFCQRAKPPFNCYMTNKGSSPSFSRFCGPFLWCLTSELHYHVSIQLLSNRNYPAWAQEESRSSQGNSSPQGWRCQKDMLDHNSFPFPLVCQLCLLQFPDHRVWKV